MSIETDESCCATTALKASFLRQQAVASTPLSYEQRVAMLTQLRAAIKANVDPICEAIALDFGSRSKHEIIIAEIHTCLATIQYTLKHLKQWMRPQRRHTGWLHQPAKAKVMFQPKGVVGIISPWNYPFYLAVGPLVAALAAGNRVLIKPSEVTPNTASFLVGFLANIFHQDQVYVAEGDARLAQIFASLAFDHLLFTGSTGVGKQIMAAAAPNLTPLTLELGGKSPAVLHPTYSVAKFAARIVATKTMNAGQTCVAPDYLMVPEHQVEVVVAGLKTEFKRCFNSIEGNPDYGAVINERHRNRLEAVLRDAKAKGARLAPLSDENVQSLKLPLTLVLNVNDDMLLMQEEIFGPVLPIVAYKTLADAVAYINQGERPLALYYFDNDRSRCEQVLGTTVSGNACVNEALMHVGVDDLPFGGIGASGMGAYHGKEGFETFSHKKGVLLKGRFNTANFIRPPYTPLLQRFIRWLVQ